MATKWNADRWTKPKVNEAGDTVYERRTDAGEPKEKKAPANKKA